jgi:thiol-disulfide isomerase/thioredoxin
VKAPTLKFKAKSVIQLAALLLATMASALSAATGATGEVQPFGRGSWKAIRAAHAGSPVVMHFWGVTCGPCRVEMPVLGRLLKERPDLDLVMINADLVPDAPEAVAAMLAETGLAGAENWMFADGFVERLRYEVDPRWQGEIPMTVLITRNGSTTKIEGAADPDAIRRWLDSQMLSATKP